MSLVAYGASDDSEQSDNDAENPEDKICDGNDVPISDEEDEIQTRVNSTTSFSSTFIDSTLSSDTGPTKQDLPHSHKKEEIVVEESELEEEVQQKPSELADAPKPPPKRTKQPVKITIPSLNDVPDEEDDESKQKPVASSVRSGLFSLLPAPIHSARKEINRPLIPHSLGGKKTLSSKTASIQPKPASTSSDAKNNGSASTISQSAGTLNKSSAMKTALIGYGSDSDEDGDDEMGNSENFFSLGSTSLSSGPKTVTTGNESVLDKETVATEIEGKGDELNSDIKTDTLPLQEETVTPLEPGLTNDSPLSFNNASRFSSWSSASSNYLGGLKPNLPSYASTSGHYSSYTQSYVGQETNAQYNIADADDSSQLEHTDPTGDSDVDLQKVLNDKEFQKLNGKRKRGMEEAISFVDAKVDDYVDPSELSKYVTEESEYAPKKNKDDMPTSQQKRKKQITYLAFQAKEKELELKNTWAQNKLTRRQTQAKYGF